MRNEYKVIRKSVLTISILIISILLASVALAAETDCLVCHSDKATGKSVHAAVGRGCKICHIGVNAESIPHVIVGAAKGLPFNGEQLCYGCHEKKKIMGKRDVHMPVQSGMCTSCHDPHSSKFDSLLISENVCFNCHDKAGYTSKGTVHAPVAMGMCTSCHDPHSTRSDKLLLSENICFNCHDKEKHDSASHVPVRLGMCASCHEPHQSDYVKLTKANKQDLCLICHTSASAPSSQGQKGIEQAFKEFRITIAHF